MQRTSNLRKLVFTGLFAAIIFIGISMLRIPLPALVGKPFIHFGNTLMVLAILFLGGGYGFVASAIGLGGFDLLNGYAATSWLTVLECAVMAIVVSSLFKAFKGAKRPLSVGQIITISVTAGVTKVITSYLVSIVEALMVGTSFKVAIVASFLSLTSAAINAVSTAIVVPILYLALRGAFKNRV
ncbi:ECF transporter S component [Lacticaseibacillus baoqingensis]|uniref:ECF transporter S component n=1 Tax=Lacticaseibacillus baoqingensis TaxID=2486013 RepID=A0ABW4E1L4_9LACO|nr:ECF transporter S component [Lacticaseibacillus baoqingensis]